MFIANIDLSKLIESIVVLPFEMINKKAKMTEFSVKLDRIAIRSPEYPLWAVVGFILPCAVLFPQNLLAAHCKMAIKPIAVYPFPVVQPDISLKIRKMFLCAKVPQF